MHTNILVELKKIVLLAFALVLLSTAMIGAFMSPVKAAMTIYIRADGSVDPDTAPISTVENITYTFTDNIFSQSIVVERDNIAVDGAGYTLQGIGSGVGLNLTAGSNVTIKNMEIEAFEYGIWLENGSKNNSISANNITNNEVGISIKHSLNNAILGNNIANNDYGIFSYQSLNNSLSGNRIADNGQGIKFYGCSKNQFFGNEITNNTDGVIFSFSHNTNFSRNNVTLNRNGISLVGSSNNTIYENNIANNEEGISLVHSPRNNVPLNNITSNQYGIVLSGPYTYSSGENIVYGNNITNNDFGIQVISPGNIIYYNNFINNTNQVYTDIYSTFQANYWSDYKGKDRNGDNIGDTLYGDYLDRFPLMRPWTLGWIPKPSVDQALEEEIPLWMQWWFWTIMAVVIVTLAGAVYLKKRKPPITTVSPIPSEGIT
jgi:parallel beta-helix repeat protein